MITSVLLSEIYTITMVIETKTLLISAEQIKNEKKHLKIHI